MKTFTQYLQESKQTWRFKIKTIHELDDDQCDRIEKHLLKYDSNGLGAVKKTMLQSAPKDFPQHRGYEVFSYEFETQLPATSAQIQNEVRNMLGLTDSTFKIRGEHEPDHVEGDQPEASDDSTDVDSTEYYGDEFNQGFIKELLKLRKQQEKEKDDE